MHTYTLPTRQTDKQLRHLLERAAQSQQPIFLTREKTDASGLVLLKNHVYERMQKS